MLTGGRCATSFAIGYGTPWPVSPLVRVLGRLEARPAIMREKKMPMDRAMPEFWNVARMPEAWPRWLAGTALMTAAVLGEVNRPEPTPLPKISSAKAQ